MKPRCTHYRYVHSILNGEDPVDVLMPAGLAKSLGLGPYMDPRGGFTSVVVEVPDLEVAVVGWSRCSRTDGFNRKTGRFLAWTRAIDQATALLSPSGSQRYLRGEAAYEKSSECSPLSDPLLGVYLP